MTPYQQLKQDWQACKRCGLYRNRKQVVFLRGTIPCSVLFIGESPGKTENLFGNPFVGPAGRLQDTLVAEVLPPTVRLAYINLVGCIPLELVDDVLTKRDPTAEELQACAARTTRLISLCRPALLATLGVLAHKHLPDVLPRNCRNTPVVGLLHPAALLRMDISQRGLAYQRNIVRLRNAVHEAKIQ